MRKNKLFALISSFLFFLTSCGSAVPHPDPVVTFDGLGGTLEEGSRTTSVASGTRWSEIAKPIYKKDESISIFYTLVENDITFTVPSQFPVCANLTVFAYYSETPIVSNQVIVVGESIIPTSQTFANDDFTPITFTINYLEKPTSMPNVLYDSSLADVTLTGDDYRTLTVTPKANTIITVLIELSEDDPIILFNGNGGTVDGKEVLPVSVEKGTLFKDVTKPKAEFEDRKFLYFAFDQVGLDPVLDDYIINKSVPVFAIFDEPEPPVPPVEPNFITVEGENVTGGSETFVEQDVLDEKEISINYTIKDPYIYNGVEFDENKADVWVDEATSTVYATPKVTEDIVVTIKTRLKEVNVTFIGNGGTIEGIESKTMTITYGTTFKDIENKPVFTKESGEENLGYSFDALGTNHVTDEYKFINDSTEIYAYYNTLTISLHESEILTYGSTTITYANNLGSDISVTSNPNMVDWQVEEIYHDENYSSGYIIVNSNVNYEGTITLTVSNGSVYEDRELTINYPKTQQEAAESVDFALTQGLTDFELTFDYDNTQSGYDFFNSSLETRLCLSYDPTSKWETGTGKTNSFHATYNPSMGNTRVNISQDYPEYYFTNLKNAAYEMRKESMKGTHTLPIDNVPLKLVVHNSEGLFFALEHGYQPVFDSESQTEGTLSNNAYKIYQVAKNVCANAYKDGFTEFEKVRQLYDWLVNNTHYDHWIDSNDIENKNNYSSFYADGVFLNNGIAVCDGFSKAFTILCGIEQLPVVRSAGFATYADDEGVTHVSGHAWNYYNYKEQGTWYLICPTWSHVDQSAGEGSFFDYNFTFNSYQPFMRQTGYFYNDSYDYAYYLLPSFLKDMAKYYAAPYNYVEGLYTDLNKSQNDYIVDAGVESIYALDVFSYNGKTYNFDIKNEEQAKALVNALPDSLNGADFTINLPYSSNNCLTFLDSALKTRFGSGTQMGWYTNYADGLDTTGYKNCELYVVVKSNIN